MGRSILAIAQEAAERDGTAPAPASLFGEEAEKVATLLRVAASDTLRDILRRTAWLGHSDLWSQWAFCLLPGRYAYPLPPDYLRVIPDTEHRGGWPLGLVGPASPRGWAAWLFGGQAAPVEAGWQIRNEALWIEPTPRTTELVTIIYVSRYPVVSALRSGDYDMTGDLPVAVAPLVPRDGHVAMPEGFDYTEGGTDLTKWEAPDGWDLSVWPRDLWTYFRRINPLSAMPPLPRVRRPDFTTDDDAPALGDDHVLSLGMTFRLRRALGLDYSEVAAEYEAEIEARAAGDAGGARAFRIGRDRQAPDVWPLGGGRWMVS